MKCKPLFLKTFHLFEHCSVPWWTWPGFKLISPESNNNNWEKEFKFLYLSFEIEKWFMVSWVSNDWIFSEVSMKSNAKNSCFLQVLIASLWSGVLMCLCKKSITETIKMAKSLNLMLLLLLNQTFKKKKTRLQKVTINRLKSRCYYFESSHHLCQYHYEHEKKQNQLQLVKNKKETCKILTETHHINIMAR